VHAVSMIWLIIIGGNMELNLKKQINSRQERKIGSCHKIYICCKLMWKNSGGTNILFAPVVKVFSTFDFSCG